MNLHGLVDILADYVSRCLPWLAERPMLLALLIAVAPLLLVLAWQAAKKKTRVLTAKEQTRVAEAEYKVSQGEPGRPSG